MTSQEILEVIKSNKKLFEQNYGVLNIGIFGSYARGEANEASDIDVLVELREPKYKYLYGLKSFLEHRLHKNVDITRKGNHLRQNFLNSIEKEILYA